MDVPDFFIGDTLKGKINLTTKDPNCGSGLFAYVIPTGATIDIRWPGATATVVISSALGEVTIIDAAKGIISFVMTPTKSLLLKPGHKQALDVIVTNLAGEISTAEGLKLINILSRANG